MSEITKLYENVGVDKMCDTFAHWMQCNWKTRQCEDCEHFVYPPFTAEKQIELIKWLLQNKRLCIQKAEYSNNFYMDTLSNRLDGVDNKDFEQCLGSLVNNIWQSLTGEEKQQVKGILE